jgi:hypothetical protein
MGRLNKNNCDYFSHDNNMRNHRKVKTLRQKFTNGYSFWCMFLEFLTGADGNVFENSDLELEMLSGDFGITVTEISDIINYCIRIELLFEKDGFIYSESLNDRLTPVYKKRGVAKELSKKQQRNNGKFCNNNTDVSDITVTEKPQSKVKESKVKEIKVEEKENIPTPPIEEKLHEMQIFINTEPLLKPLLQLKNQLTYKQAEDLYAKYGHDLINKTLKSMANYKPLLQKCNSIALTLDAWCEKDKIQFKK